MLLKHLQNDFWGRLAARKAETWEKATAVFSGLVFIALVIILSIRFPQPSPFQAKLFQTILALAAAGFGTSLSGILHIELRDASKPRLRATGALALFVIVYFLQSSNAG